MFRFLAGTFAAAPLTNSGYVVLTYIHITALPNLAFTSALVGDIWDAKTRGKAMLLFAVSPFTGPALGPLVSGWIAVGGASWRWIFWVLTMFVSQLVILTLLKTDGPFFRPAPA